MLSDEEKKEIEAEFGVYADRKAAITEALKTVQKHRGWISDESVRDIGDFLAMTPDEVDSIATFYTAIHRKPVGRHVILLCDSISCWIVGYNDIREHIMQRLEIGLGQTTADNRFTLLPSACLGVCEQAPAMMIDEDVHGNLTPEKADQILEQYK
jgi:NADH-quinone oxidoreductase subunit E